MNRSLPVVMLASALALVSCRQDTGAPPGGDAPSETAVSAASPAPSLAAPSATSSSPGANPSKADPLAGENDGYPDLTPAPLTGDAAKTEKGARAILLPWARGIELREFDQSWEMMGEAGRAQRTKAEFNALFRPLRNITVAIPGGSIEGAAGSMYYNVPTTVTGSRSDGTVVTLKGEVVMRRVNDVDGATPEQLAWHIVSVDLKPD